LSIEGVRLNLNTSVTILYEFLSALLPYIYVIYGDINKALLRWVRLMKKRQVAKERKMQNFVLTGKAKTVFRLIEIKAKREEQERKKKLEKK
jgi:hypothetical protein